MKSVLNVEQSKTRLNFNS